MVFTLGVILIVLWWGVILAIFLPPIGLVVSVVGLARAPADRQRRSRWRRLVWLFGILSVGSAILAALVILVIRSLSNWPAD